MKEFKNIELKQIEPKWNSPLIPLLFDLEKLRTKKLYSTGVPPYIFFDLKEVFHLLESLGSARIEGNRTTLADFVEKKINGKTRESESTKEIDNIENALKYIHKNVEPGKKITKSLLSDVHKIITKDLTSPPDGEGSNMPGELRNVNVVVNNSELKTPDFNLVPALFDDLLEFVNQETSINNDLLITAIAHHRFAWIHPFDNGNGRLVRLLTYMMLVKQGFQVKTGSILNPTAIFCMDREGHYQHLASADKGTELSMEEWCLYVLQGLKSEIEKIDQLLDQKFLIEKILVPVLKKSLGNRLIAPREFLILNSLIYSEHMVMKAGDLDAVLGESSPVQRSRIVKQLRDKRMLKPIEPGGRIYTISFANNHLLRGVIEVLTEEGFILNLD